MFWTLIWMTGVIFLMFFCKSLGMLLAAQFLAGFAWGIFQTLTTTYAAEVAPLPLRGILTTWVNACWGIGQLIAVGLLRGMVNRTDEWAWRVSATKLPERLVTLLTSPDPLRPPVVLAYSAYYHCHLRPRVSLVARPQGQGRGGSQVAPPPLFR